MARKRLSDSEIQALLEDDIYDEFLNDITSDESSDSESGDSGDEDNLPPAEQIEDDDNFASANDTDSVGDRWSHTSKVSREAFTFDGNSGVKVTLQNPKDSKEIFQSFFDEVLMTLIVDQTNKYAAKVNDEKR